MALAQSLIGLAGSSLLVAGGARALAPARWRAPAAAAAVVLGLVPIAGIPLVGFVRGVTGDLSVTTMVLLLLGMRGHAPRGKGVHLFVLGAAALLYPTALGLGPFDAYALGFAPTPLLVGLVPIALLAWWRRSDFVLIALIGALAGYALELLESRNLWDYLLDPWLALYVVYDLRPNRRNT